MIQIGRRQGFYTLEIDDGANFCTTSMQRFASDTLPGTLFCGTSFDDASSTCTTPCSSTADCASGEACFPFTTCSSPETDMPIESFYCGSTFEEASMSCTTPCPSGYHVRVSSENGEGTGRSVATNQEDPLALLSMWRSMSNDPDIQAFRVKRFCRSDAEQRIVFLLWRAGGG